MKTGLCAAILFAIALVLAAGCSQPQAAPQPGVAIVYGSEKGDLSYTDAAYRGLDKARNETPVTVREFVPNDYLTLPDLLNATIAAQRPGLVISVGFQYAEFTRALAEAHPEIRFLAIDQAGIGRENLQAYEISSYGDSYLAGALAATASKSGKIGIIMGMKTGVLDQFRDGYIAGARAANASVVIDPAYVRENQISGFSDPAEAKTIADRMYRNGTDVIYACAGYSNTGVFDAARNLTGRYAIGTDSDQSPLAPGVVIASAVKRVDRIVYNGIHENIRGTFKGGNTVAGLDEGATGIVINPAFAGYNATVSAWETRAFDAEKKYLAARAW